MRHNPAMPAADISAAWPIGSVFISVVATNPATLLGFGTWVAFAAGRMLVGLDAGQTEFDTVEETGGEKEHTLTESEMPAHTHTYTQPNAPSNSLTVTLPTAAVVQGRTADVATGSAGGGAAHNNLPPYITVYMWKRTG